MKEGASEHFQNDTIFRRDVKKLLFKMHTLGQQVLYKHFKSLIAH